MINNYLIVNKSVLPDVFNKVVLVKELMASGECSQISDAVKQVGISRSAYYKYKDYVHKLNYSSLERKAIISFSLSHKKGILSDVLLLLSNEKCNIITINQNLPIHNVANVNISFDIQEMTIEIEKLIEKISAITGVSKCNLISIE